MGQCGLMEWEGWVLPLWERGKGRWEKIGVIGADANCVGDSALVGGGGIVGPAVMGPLLGLAGVSL